MSQLAVIKTKTHKVDGETVWNSELSNGLSLCLHSPTARELIARRELNEVFIVAQTYSESTPESAKFGDFSDQGYVFEDRFDSLSSLLSEFEYHYFHIEESDFEGSSISIYSEFTTEDYATCTDRGVCLHIKASPANIKRLHRAILKRVA